MALAYFFYRLTFPFFIKVLLSLFYATFIIIYYLSKGMRRIFNNKMKSFKLQLIYAYEKSCLRMYTVGECIAIL